jgi:uncharacterized protein (DUF433 family)
MKKLIAAVTTAGLLIVGTAGVASAADSSTTTAPVAAAKGHNPALRAHRIKAALKLAASTIGIQPKDLAQQIKDGKSVADVAKAHNVDPQKVIDAVVNAADKKVDDAVTAGKLDSTKAATIKDRLPARVEKLVNGTLKGKHPVARAELRRKARRGGVAVAASTIGITPQALRDAVKGGQTVADVAKAHNVDPQKVIDALDAAAAKKIDAAVTSGKLDSTRAGQLKDRIDQRIETLVNNTPHRAAGASS